MGKPVSDKAVVLARGLGTRMRKAAGDARLTSGQAAVADTGVKAMIPIRRPFLDYVLTALADAGWRRACLVIGPEHDELRNYYRSVDRHRMSIEFATQAEPQGTADAVAAAEGFAGGDPFLCVNSDNYYPPGPLRSLRDLHGMGLAVFEQEAMLAGSNISLDRLARFAVVRANADGWLEQIIEKPEPSAVAALGQPRYISMNCWRFGPQIFHACRAISPSPRGELEITDAVQYAIDSLGVRFRVVPCKAPVLDLTGRDDVAPVAERLEGLEVYL
ncbi:MAG TPA: nucleotidyltransferase family protein [Phycisphaerae bacterium]|nr:nucleotidyltransferase family protein [Phycisphaerae bacterium]